MTYGNKEFFKKEDLICPQEDIKGANIFRQYLDCLRENPHDSLIELERVLEFGAFR